MTCAVVVAPSATICEPGPSLASMAGSVSWWAVAVDAGVADGLVRVTASPRASAYQAGLGRRRSLTALSRWWSVRRPRGSPGGAIVPPWPRIARQNVRRTNDGRGARATREGVNGPFWLFRRRRLHHRQESFPACAHDRGACRTERSVSRSTRPERLLPRYRPSPRPRSGPRSSPRTGFDVFVDTTHVRAKSEAMCTEAHRRPERSGACGPGAGRRSAGLRDGLARARYYRVAGEKQRTGGSEPTNRVHGGPRRRREPVGARWRAWAPRRRETTRGGGLGARGEATFQQGVQRSLLAALQERPLREHIGHTPVQVLAGGEGGGGRRNGGTPEALRDESTNARKSIV